MDAFNCDVVYRSTEARKLNHLHAYCVGHIVGGGGGRQKSNLVFKVIFLWNVLNGFSVSKKFLGSRLIIIIQNYILLLNVKRQQTKCFLLVKFKYILLLK
jgi:hypothetical protein